MAANSPPPKGYEAFDDHIPSNSSPGSQTTRLTPDSDSDDSDLDIHAGELSQGVELRRLSKSRDVDGPDDELLGVGGGRRASMSTTHSFQLYTPDEERAVVRKFDRRLVLFVAFLYMLSFRDRSSAY